MSCSPMAGIARLVESLCAAVLKGSWNNIGSLRLTSPTIVSQLLLQLGHEGYGVSHSWPFFTWLEGSSKSLQATWTMIHVLAKHKHYRAAQNLLDKISQRNFLSSPTVLNALILTNRDDVDVSAHVLSWLVISYAKSRMTEDAVEVMEQMFGRGLKPHPHACTALLKRLVGERRTDSAWKALKKMRRAGVAPNRHVYNVMIHACCFSGETERAEALVAEMEREGVKPDLVTFNTLMWMYCKRRLHYEAQGVQERMARAGVEADTVTQNSMLHALCREGRMHEAEGIVRGLVVVNEVTYSILVDGFSRAGELDECLRVMELMRAKGLPPGAVPYNSVLRLLCREGRMREANRLLLDMTDRRVQPDQATCNTLLNAYCKIADLTSALRVRDSMLRSSLPLDAFSHKALVHGFSRARLMDSAVEALFAMIRAGFPPNYPVLSWIVDGFLDSGDDGSLVTALPARIAREGLLVDLPALARSFVRRLCKRDRLDLAEEIFRVSRQEIKGWDGDCLVYASLAYGNFKAGNCTRFNEIGEEMYRRRLMITRKIYMSFNDSRSKDGHALLAKFWDMLADRLVMSRDLLNDIRKGL